VGGGQSFKDQGGREGGEGAGQGPGCIYDNKISSNKNSNSKEFLFFFFFFQFQNVDAVVGSRHDT